MRLIILLPFVFILGCATSGTVKETRPPAVELSKYQDFYLKVSTDRNELKHFVKPLSETISNQIKMTQTFPKVRRKIASKNGLVMKLKLKSFEEGSSWARILNMGGEAKLKAEAHLYDLASKKKIAILDLEGTSLDEDQSSMSVGGVPVYNSKWGNNGLDSRTERAMHSMSVYLAKYFKEKRQN